MGLGGISVWQLLIVLVIVLLLFGTKKLRNIGGDLGGAIKSFKKSMKDGDAQDNQDEAQSEQSEQSEAQLENQDNETLKAGDEDDGIDTRRSDDDTADRKQS